MRSEAEEQRIMESGIRLLIERDGRELVVAVDVDDGRADSEALVLGTPGPGDVRRCCETPRYCELTGASVYISQRDCELAQDIWTEKQDEDREARREAAEMRGAL